MNMNDSLIWRCHFRSEDYTITMFLGKQSLEKKTICLEVETTVQFPHSPIIHYAFSSLIGKTMTKTIHCHWENRFVLQ